MGTTTHAWLRMVAAGGGYPLPTSEASYGVNRSLFDVLIPANGGTLLADGSWEQKPERIDNDWAQGLPELAQQSGQRYTPSVSAMQAALHTVLDDEGLWAVAADNLVTLATSTRFDKPWQAVVYDAIDASQDRQVAHGNFVLALSTAVRQAGLPFHLSYYGVTWDNPAYFPISVAPQAADVFIYYCYAWWAQPRMVSPYWWVRASLDFALTQGMVPSRTVLGCALYSTWWPVTGVQPHHDMTHGQAMEIVHENNATVEWMETSDYGLVREKYADTGDGYVALTDGDTLRHKLDLIDEYGLRGLMLFTPGLGDGSVWPTITEWKQPGGKPADFFTGAPTGAREVMN